MNHARVPPIKYEDLPVEMRMRIHNEFLDKRAADERELSSLHEEVGAAFSVTLLLDHYPLRTSRAYRISMDFLRAKQNEMFFKTAAFAQNYGNEKMTEVESLLRPNSYVSTAFKNTKMIAV